MPCATPSISGKNRCHYLDKPENGTQYKWNNIQFRGAKEHNNRVLTKHMAVDEDQNTIQVSLQFPCFEGRIDHHIEFYL